MAHYIRFEVFVPVVYKLTSRDSRTGKKETTIHALPEASLLEFVEATRENLEGITQADPMGPAPFKGWWQRKNQKTIVIDRLTYLFCLAKIHESEKAREFFAAWKQKLESSLEQQEILVMYFPVQTIGDFF
jgi:hypothetical protein